MDGFLVVILSTCSKTAPSFSTLRIVPTVEELCFYVLLDDESPPSPPPGLNHQGIYRLPGVKSKVEELKSHFDKGLLVVTRIMCIQCLHADRV